MQNWIRKSESEKLEKEQNCIGRIWKIRSNKKWKFSPSLIYQGEWGWVAARIGWLLEWCQDLATCWRRVSRIGQITKMMYPFSHPPHPPPNSEFGVVPYLQCKVAPPRFSADTTSPNAAYTRGGPARNIVPILCTITASWAIVGM